MPTSAKVGTLTESLQHSYFPPAGSGRCVCVPHGQWATRSPVRGGAREFSSSRGVQKGRSATLVGTGAPGTRVHARASRPSV
ncbi:unnamed protein product [Ectocarpus sp. CCAP 1310/34]|nr:unnamed protein product [Ectocarpus sp. CCAP 1310/34]